MSIALDENGDFKTVGGKLTTVTGQAALNQNAMSETRCLQDTWPVDLTFGRNQLVWGLSQSPRDRIADLVRISSKYFTVKAATYDPERKIYNVQS